MGSTIGCWLGQKACLDFPHVRSTSVQHRFHRSRGRSPVCNFGGHFQSRSHGRFSDRLDKGKQPVFDIAFDDRGLGPLQDSEYLDPSSSSNPPFLSSLNNMSLGPLEKQRPLFPTFPNNIPIQPPFKPKKFVMWVEDNLMGSLKIFNLIASWTCKSQISVIVCSLEQEEAIAAFLAYYAFHC
ncbi:hypothetical protein SUGI_0313520 [Cryptomeria japonica]|nr:hypothetical protein SUGI_0313520 [Cryptomeria japonica]